MTELFGDRVEAVDTPTICTYPDSSVRFVLIQTQHGGVTQALGASGKDIGIGLHGHFSDIDQSFADTACPHVIVIVIVE